jgi:RHS repeat-associated protein
VLTTTVHPKTGNALVTTNVYDQYNLLSTTDPYGRKTSYTYDLMDRVLSSSVALRPGGATITTRFEYDAQGRMNASVDGNGVRYEYQYDARDRRTLKVSAVGTPVQATESYGYDGNNNLLSMTDKNGKVWAKSYTARDRVRTEIDPLGNTSSYDYYADGLVKKMINPNGHATEYVYDTCCGLESGGRLTQVIDADHNTINFEYDSNGNRTKATDQSGRVTAYEYDGLNRLTKTIVDPGGLSLQTLTLYDQTPGAIGRKEVVTSPAGRVVTTSFDGLRRPSNIDGDTPHLSYTYDVVEGGLLKTTVTDANNNSRSTLTDGMGRAIRTIDGLGHAAVMTYDNNGNQVLVVDQDGRRTRQVFDQRNRRTSEIGAEAGINATTLYVYDAADNLLQITDAEGKVTRYFYDDARRRSGATYGFDSSEAKTWSYDYWPMGQLKRISKPGGVIIIDSYDNLERLASRAYSTGAADIFTYHANGLLKTAVSGLYNNVVDRSDLAQDYDGANRLLQERQKIGAGEKTVAYGYDPDSLITEMIYPCGTVVQQSYTNRRELREVKVGKIAEASHIYDPAGRLQSRTFANGKVTNWNYDSDDRITGINHVGVQAWDYRYTDEGDALVQDDLTTPNRGESYAYDGLHRLRTYRRGRVVGNTVPTPSLQQSWTLDKVGNWTSWNNNGVTETRTHDSHNALTSRSTVSRPLSYDADLNQTDDGTSPFVFEYDANDHLKLVRDRAIETVVASYKYDALGRRVEKFIAGTPNKVVRYYYSGERIVEERDRNDAVVATYTYGNYVDEPLTMDRGGERYYYHSNRLFSTYALTNAAGSIVERYAYTAYGEATTFNAAYQQAQSSSRVGNPFTFTGRELDSETRLMYYRARTFDAVQGRFRQRDPREYVDGVNLYQAYFAPNGVDPSGTISDEDIKALKKIACEVTSGRDLSKVEYGFRIYRNKEGELVAGKTLEGIKDQVLQSFEDSLPPEGANQLSVGDAHTHPLDLGASHADIGGWNHDRLGYPQDPSRKGNPEQLINLVIGNKGCCKTKGGGDANLISLEIWVWAKDTTFFGVNQHVNAMPKRESDKPDELERYNAGVKEAAEKLKRDRQLDYYDRSEICCPK